MNKQAQPGSKLDKAVKLVKAMNAIADLAPFGGGLPMVPELAAMHDELNKRFNKIAEECGITEHALGLMVKTAMEDAGKHVAEIWIWGVKFTSVPGTLGQADAAHDVVKKEYPGMNVVVKPVAE